MTKVLVPPVRERHGELVGCTGFTMEDGRVFRANRRGHVEVPDLRTAQQAVSNPLAPGGVAIYTGGVPRTASATCGTCGFNGYPFHRSAPCPRCDSENWENREDRED